MNPDKLDIKIQEAAAQNVPAYTEDAWDAMERVLDKEMPQKKKDRKKLFWWFLLLFFIAGGSLLFLWNGSNKKNSTIAMKSGNVNTLTDKKDSISLNRNRVIIKSDAKKINSIKNKNQDVTEKSASSNLLTTRGIHNANNERKVVRNNKRNTDIVTKRNDVVHFFPPQENKSHDHQPEKTIAEKINNDQRKQKPDPTVALVPAQSVSGKISKIKNQDSILNSEKRNSNQNISGKKSASPKSEKRFRSPFAFQFSIGPDVSAVSLKNFGETKLVYGAGFSYAINKKFAIRTGFYVSRKVYDATPSEYNPPSAFWNYYPDLKYIDADCKIFEVPLILNYQFKKMPKHSWFASAGLSSYFMKTEDYNYFSKSPSGQTWYNNYFIKNKNQHYFASLRLSAGYEKKVNKNVSVMAEPYINLPLKGIGFGKVNLYSAGVLFSLSINPFHKK